MLRGLIIGLFLLFCCEGITQNISDFEYLNESYGDELYLGLGLSRGFLSNPVAPNPEVHSVSRFSLLLDMERPKTELGQMSFTYSNKLLGDLFNLLKDIQEDRKAIYRKVESHISSGILGWFGFRWNVTKPNKFQLMTGFQLNDYFLTTTYEDSTDRISHEPQGYFLAAGPNVSMRWAVGNFALLRTNFQYSFSYLRGSSVSYAERDDSYPKSHWINADVEFLTKWGIYAGGQWLSFVNRGNLPNRTKRLDIFLGFRIML